MKAGDKLDQPLGVREHDDTLVILEVLPGVALDVLFAERLLEAVDTGFQPGQAGFSHPLRGQTSGQSFQVLADEEEFEDVLFRELNDKGTPLGKNFHQPLLLQPVDRFPYRGPADAQGFGQLTFV